MKDFVVSMLPRTTDEDIPGAIARFNEYACSAYLPYEIGHPIGKGLGKFLVITAGRWGGRRLRDRSWLNNLTCLVIVLLLTLVTLVAAAFLIRVRSLRNRIKLVAVVAIMDVLRLCKGTLDVIAERSTRSDRTGVIVMVPGVLWRSFFMKWAEHTTVSG